MKPVKHITPPIPFDGEERITYKIIYSKRRTLSLKITGDYTFDVKVPLKTKDAVITSYIEEHRQWVYTHLERYRMVPSVPPLTGIPGSLVMRHLNRYTLLYKEGVSAGVVLEGSSVVVTHTSSAKSSQSLEIRGKTLILEWYKEEILTIAHATLQWVREQFLSEELQPALGKALMPMQSAGGWRSGRDGQISGNSESFRIDHAIERLDQVQFQVRTMKRRWGSCYGERARIVLNRMLAMGRDNMIEYVVVHEICHLWFHYHNRDFYHLLGVLLPDWKERRKELMLIEKVG